MSFLVIAILSFVSLSLIFYLVYPIFERRMQSWHKKRMGQIRPRLDDIFIDIPARKFIALDAGFTFLGGVAAFILTEKIIFALLAALISLVVVTFVVKQLEVARKRKFAGQLVDGLMILSGSLKAGLSLLQSFETLVEEMPPPISQEFSLVLRENRMGVPLEECLQKLKRRMICEDLNMMITAILVGRETGGNLTLIFSNLVTSIRDRDRLLGKVKALCIQGKLQGRIMMVLPIIFAYGVFRLDPHFLDVMMQDQFGRMLLGYAVISEVIGVILINRLSKIEV